MRSASGDELVIGVRAEYPDGVGLVSFARQRDASLASEDHIRIVIDTYRDGRSGYVFSINPHGARYDALVANQGEGENSNWDAVWEAETSRTPTGWTAEIRIPIRSLLFGEGLDAWGLNIERRIQRLQQTDRWASPERDYKLTQTSRAGLLTDLPSFDLGIGLSLRPSVTAGAGKPAPGVDLEDEQDLSLDATQRLGGNTIASLTVNTDFAETEVDTRRTNLSRFPLVFPEKRTFFLEGSDIFEFGLGLNDDVRPFFSRRIGLLEGREVPIDVGGKISGRLGSTNFGALVVRSDEMPGLVPGTTMGVLRVKQNVLRESSIGMISTVSDPRGLNDSWVAGADFTYQTSQFRGDKNFLVGLWGLAMDREALTGRAASPAVEPVPGSRHPDQKAGNLGVGDRRIPLERASASKPEKALSMPRARQTPSWLTPLACASSGSRTVASRKWQAIAHVDKDAHGLSGGRFHSHSAL